MNTQINNTSNEAAKTSNEAAKTSNEAAETSSPTHEEILTLAQAQFQEQVKAIRRNGELKYGLKVGGLWILGAAAGIFGMTMASAMAIRVSKNKLGVDLNPPSQIIVTDPGTAQALLTHQA